MSEQVAAPSLWARARTRYRTFFFDDEPVTAAVVFRHFFALWTLAYFLPRLRHAWELYCRPVLRSTAKVWQWLGEPLPPLWLVYGLFAVLLTGLLLLVVVRRYARLIHVAILAPMLVLFALDTMMPRAYGALALTQWLLLLAAPYDRLRDHPGGPVLRAPRFGLRIMRLQFSSVYFFTVLSKLVDGNNWLNGRALEFAFKNPRYGDFLLSQIDLPRWGYQVMGIGTLACELFVAFGIWAKPTRRWAMLVVVGMHTMMMLTLRVSPLFHSLMIGQLLLFVPASTYARWFPRWFSDPPPPDPSATLSS